MIRRMATRVRLAAVPDLHLAVKQNPEVRAKDEIPTSSTGQEGYPKLSLKKRSPIAARNDDLKVFNGRR
jgi:hypothetical protein